VGHGSAALAASGIVGAAIVLVADLVAQHAFAGVAVPVGIVTGLIGAPYLLWLIARGNRRGSDG
jgi:iron complex transport system permease protein